MTVPRLTFADTYPGGRILLMLGQHQVGAVFPPPIPGNSGMAWRWHFFLNDSVGGHGCWEGRAKTEQAAKNAILAEARDWLTKAGLQDG